MSARHKPQIGGYREGAGRKPERPEGPRDARPVVVPLTPVERRELEELAAGAPLAPILRRAPAEVARWRAIADALADAIAGDAEDPGAALEEYQRAAGSPASAPR